MNSKQLAAARERHPSMPFFKQLYDENLTLKEQLSASNEQLAAVEEQLSVVRAQLKRVLDLYERSIKGWP